MGGCSGGGVLSSWVIGHTDRFAAAAVRCPVIDWISLRGRDRHSAVHLQLLREAVLGRPDAVAQAVEPHVRRQREDADDADDRRCSTMRTPMPQTEEYYSALKMRGVPAVLLRFENEWHGTSSRPVELDADAAVHDELVQEVGRGGGGGAGD